MSDEPPTPPAALPGDVVDALSECSPDLLRSVAGYAEELAEYGERETSTEDRAGNGIKQPTEDPSEGVPSRATITVKEINDNRYYYWQWRDGDQVRSKYELPVEPDE